RNPMNKFFTYILFSPKFNKHYFGHTSNLQKRITEHNSGLSTFTKKYLPWELIYFEEFNSRAEAMKINPNSPVNNFNSR
ncbi:GIY-YIG nuclease family protein, partial [Ignavibacterium sp.]|uniref:GIY-YIG nuclease family protein n=1 Tax=Ignavibacterium sp. TaxID=2651167 RepID=UPI0032976F31